MGPYHHFLLMEKRCDVTLPSHLFASRYGKELNRIEISDDVIQYIFDSTKWMQTITPADHIDANDRLSSGLNTHGETLFPDIEQFKRIIEAWTALFSLAPETFFLTSPYGQYSDENGMTPLSVKYVRDDLLKTFQKLSDACQECIQAPNKKELIHRGI